MTILLICNCGNRLRGAALRTLRYVTAMIVIAACWLTTVSNAAAQGPVAPKKPPATAQNLSLKSRDGVLLAATFYPSSLEKDAIKEAVPVILLHAYKGSRADYNGLALVLQKSGCAVLVPDLRGHGQSNRRMLPDGTEKSIDVALLNKQDLAAMVENDLEACKSFLMDKNNAQQLNIDKLCVVGAEMGAAVAINWAAWDWHWPRLATGKQGQDVKAVVLLSPQWSFKGLMISTALADREFTSQLSWLIAVGSQDASAKDVGEAKRLHQLLEKLLPPLAKSNGAPAVDYRPLSTSLQGTKLLATQNLAGEIVNFINGQVAKSAHPWNDRANPLGK